MPSRENIHKNLQHHQLAVVPTSSDGIMSNSDSFSLNLPNVSFQENLADANLATQGHSKNSILNTPNTPSPKNTDEIPLSFRILIQTKKSASYLSEASRQKKNTTLLPFLRDQLKSVPKYYPIELVAPMRQAKIKTPIFQTLPTEEELEEKGTIFEQEALLDDIVKGVPDDKESRDMNDDERNDDDDELGENDEDEDEGDYGVTHADEDDDYGDDFGDNDEGPVYY